MRTTSFGFPETAVDRFLREERERTKLFREVLGGGAVAEAIRQATAQHKLLRGLDLARPARGVLDLLERDRKDRAAFDQLTSTAWALSVTETARGIAARNQDFVAEQRRLSATMIDTIGAFERNRTAVTAALAAASAGDTVRRLIDEALPRVAAFGAIAERMRTVDAMTLRASEGAVASATALAAEMVMETQRLAEAIAAAPTEEASGALVDALIDLIAGFVSRLGPNTITELQNMGLFQWSGWLAGMLGLLLAIAAMQPARSPQEQAALADLTQKVEQLQQESRQYQATEARADEAYVADLPRAELARDATLRRQPKRGGAVVLKAARGTVLAIEESRGRWRLVVFRDPVSTQLARAWVYGTAVTPLAPPVTAGGR